MKNLTQTIGMRFFWAVLVTALGIFVLLTVGRQQIDVYSTQKAEDRVILAGKISEISQTWMAEQKNIFGVDLYIDDNKSRLTGQEEFFLEIREHNSAGELLLEASGDLNSEGKIQFRFAQVPLTLGEKYYFEINMGAGENSELYVFSNRDYGGMKVGDENTSAAAKMAFWGERTSQIGWLLVILWIFISISFAYSLLFHRKFEETIGLALATVAMLLYIAGIFNHLLIGVRVVILAAGAAWVYICIQWAMKKFLLKNILTPGFLFFLVLIAFMTVYNRTAWAFRAEWDEYSYWGIAVKDMFYYDSLSVHPGTTVYLNRYVPIMPLIQYFFVWLRGGFNDGTLYFAYQFAAFSFILPIFARISWKEKRKGGILAVILLVFPLTVFSSFYYSIYIDAFLGIIAGYVLISYFRNRDGIFRWLCVGMGTGILVLTKEMGCVLLIGIAIVIIAELLFKSLQKESRKERLRSFFGSRDLWKFGMICLFGVLCFGSYQLYRHANLAEMIAFGEETGPAGAESMDYTELLPLEKLINIVKGSGEPYQYQSIRNFISQFCSGDSFHGLSFLNLLLVLLFLAILWKKCLKGKDYTGICIGLIGAGIFYAVVLQIFYLTIFSSYEAENLSSSSRYLGTFLLMAILTILYLFLEELLDGRKKYWREGLLAIMFFTILLAPLENFYTKWCFDDRLVEQLNDCYSYTRAAFGTFADEGEAIYHINTDEEKGGIQHCVFRDAMVPVSVQNLNWSIHTKEKNELMSGDIMSVSEWEEILYLEYEYVYLDRINTDFINSYKELFENEELKEGGIYCVERLEEGKVLLKEIAFAIH